MFLSLEAGMTKCTKDTFGYLGTEPMALREQLEQLAAALEAMAKAEGTEAMKAASEAARQVATRATELVEEVSGAASEGRSALAGAIRDKPLLAVSLAAAAGFLAAILVRR